MSSQRVNLQYSVSMEELPSETARLIAKAHKAILEAAHQLSELHEADIPLTIACLQNVDSVRRKLADADYVLQDIQNIVNGYLSFVSQEANPEESMNPLSPQQIDIQELENKLDNFREAMSQAGIVDDNDSTEPPPIAE